MQASGTPRPCLRVNHPVIGAVIALASLPLVTGCPGPKTPAPMADEVILPGSIPPAPGFGHGNLSPASPHGRHSPVATANGGGQEKPTTPETSPDPEQQETPKPDVAETPKPDEGLAKLARAGKRVWSRYQCYTCHRVNGRGGSNGPDLTGVGTKYTTIKGSPDKARGWFQLHLTDPQKYPGTDHQNYFVKMPKFPFSDNERTELVEFLMMLK